MLSMRFKNFVWPNNPYSCSLTTRREIVTHKFPGGGYCLEDLGKGLRVLKGKGEFFGPGAYGNLQGLLEVFEEGGPGQLIHPVVQLKRAVFTELELMQEPRADYVLYQFVFCEDDGDIMAEPVAGSETGSHGIQSGESLWEIAAMYGTTAESLLAANSWIRNPNALETGRTVVIP